MIIDSKLFAVNKPIGITSNQLLQKIRYLLNTKKVGHAGTLDPLATGVLVVGVGQATKELATAVKKDKEYLATVVLGQTSTTDDEEGEKIIYPIKAIPTLSQIKKILTNFTGNILQTPPLYSAIKIKGKEAYKRARAGERFKLAQRSVEIKKIQLIKYQWPSLTLKVTTGPGVYIRALARDIGRSLGVGGYLGGLIRTRVGQFTLRQAINYQDLEVKFKAEI